MRCRWQGRLRTGSAIQRWSIVADNSVRLPSCALVLLRLAIGWHFFREGSAKLAYDPRTKRFDVAFSAEGFLPQAKGPLAD